MAGRHNPTGEILSGIKWLEGDPNNFSASGEGDQYWVDTEVTRRIEVAKGEFAGINILEFGVSRTYNAAGACEESVLSVGITPVKSGKEGDRIGSSVTAEGSEINAAVLERLPDDQLSRAASVITMLRTLIEREQA